MSYLLQYNYALSRLGDATGEDCHPMQTLAFSPWSATADWQHQRHHFVTTRTGENDVGDDEDDKIKQLTSPPHQLVSSRAPNTVAHLY